MGLSSYGSTGLAQFTCKISNVHHIDLLLCCCCIPVFCFCLLPSLADVPFLPVACTHVILMACTLDWCCAFCAAMCLMHCLIVLSLSVLLVGLHCCCFRLMVLLLCQGCYFRAVAVSEVHAAACSCSFSAKQQSCFHGKSCNLSYLSWYDNPKHTSV